MTVTGDEPEIAAKIARFFRAVEDGFHHALKKARDDGELAADLDPRAVARLIVNTIQGVALLGKVFKDKKAAKSVVRAASSLLRSA